ncbi:lysophospholipid acyltransferase family protein [Propionivibrio dicarboxylicus]|uniref:KDO2-lipid IV(A) lauroyltransferase n=1 Tax=Propionivibrio dicarboxylicus TaxID=83767 RepID=A0A1G8KZQ7_9RHOO|nr:lipid A biosynthesis acyltransferase [Propionivibrio dicarboxylicus]SDI48886.1 KDO2-lipid IV(A) lauroyltransferase [Propionivibrio dicarboxylicus]
MAKRLLSHAAVALFWLLHFLPLPLLAALGRGLGRLLLALGKRRRHIAATNLALCFPELDAAAREQRLRAHFEAIGRSLLERSLLWWSRPERLRQLVRVEGEEKIRALIDAGKPVIMLAPHFVGLDAGGVALAMRFDALSIYSTQKNPVFNTLLYRGRKRFGDQKLLSRQEGALATIKAMRAGRPFYYLPDMDFGRRDSIFAPFFGVPAATITGLSRLARAAGATVLFTVTRMLPDGGYVLEIGDPWPDFPTADADADTRRMNEAIEAVVRTMPEQYYWVHRRFKTRPEGEPSFY